MQQWLKTRKRLIREIDLLTNENDKAAKALYEKTASVNALLRAIRRLDFDLKKEESKNVTLQSRIKELEKEIMERDFMEGFMENDV